MIEPIFYALFGIFVGSTFVSNVLICAYLGSIVFILRKIRGGSDQ